MPLFNMKRETIPRHPSLPIRLVELDDHIYLVCVHSDCKEQQPAGLVLNRLANGADTSNGQMLHSAIQHAFIHKQHDQEWKDQEERTF